MLISVCGFDVMCLSSCSLFKLRLLIEMNVGCVCHSVGGSVLLPNTTGRVGRTVVGRWGIVCLFFNTIFVCVCRCFFFFFYGKRAMLM